MKTRYFGIAGGVVLAALAAAALVEVGSAVPPVQARAAKADRLDLGQRAACKDGSLMAACATASGETRERARPAMIQVVEGPATTTLIRIPLGQ